LIQRFDGNADALRDGFDVVLQRGLGIRVPQVGQHVLHAGDLSQVLRTRAPEHLVSHALDSGIAAGSLQDAEKEIVCVDRGTVA